MNKKGILTGFVASILAAVPVVFADDGRHDDQEPVGTSYTSQEASDYESPWARSSDEEEARRSADEQMESIVEENRYERARMNDVLESDEYDEREPVGSSYTADEEEEYSDTSRGSRYE